MTTDDRETPPRSPVLVRDWKYYIGMTCLALSLLLPLFGLLVPSLGLSTELAATLIAGLLVGGPEVMLVLAAVFLGKDTLAYYKAKVWAWFKRPLRPVGRFQYYLGLGLVVASQIPHYLHAYFPGALPGQVGSDLRFYLLLGSDLVLVLSFLIMGDEFWDKFRRLFIHEGRIATASR